MTFDGTNDYLQGAFTNSGALSQPFSVYAVAKLDATAVNDNNTHYLMDGDDTSNTMRFFDNQYTNPDKWTMRYGGAEIYGNATDANAHVFSILSNGASSQFWKDTDSEVSGDAGSANAW